MNQDFERPLVALHPSDDGYPARHGRCTAAHSRTAGEHRWQAAESGLPFIISIHPSFSNAAFAAPKKQHPAHTRKQCL